MRHAWRLAINWRHVEQVKMLSFFLIPGSIFINAAVSSYLFMSYLTLSSSSSLAVLSSQSNSVVGETTENNGDEGHNGHV